MRDAEQTARPVRATLAMLAAAMVLGACDTAALSPANSRADAAATEGGYAATGAVLSATDEGGSPRYALRAAHIQQGSSTAPVLLRDVTVEFPDSRGQSWVVTAAEGRMSSTRRQQPAIVDLTGNVRLSSRSADAGALALETSALRFDTARNRATTDQKVTLLAGSRRIEAQGMTADLGTRRLRLESNVHGRFTP